jgi:transcriptional regulator with XRE-family HTH domain
MEDIGTRIQTRRTQLGLTQQQLAVRIGKREKDISRWENDKNDPDPENYPELAAGLETTTDYLHGVTDDPDARVQAVERIEELAQEGIDDAKSRPGRGTRRSSGSPRRGER